MVDQDFIRELCTKAAEMFPAGEEAKEQIQKDLYQLLQRSLSQMELVNQKEFLSQLAVLEQANKKISDLEKKLEEIESQKNKD